MSDRRFAAVTPKPRCLALRTAVAKASPALILQRACKSAISYADSQAIFVAGRGKHFGRDVTDPFIVRFEDFVVIAERNEETV